MHPGPLESQPSLRPATPGKTVDCSAARFPTSTPIHRPAVLAVGARLANCVPQHTPPRFVGAMPGASRCLLGAPDPSHTCESVCAAFSAQMDGPAPRVSCGWDVAVGSWTWQAVRARRSGSRPRPLRAQLGRPPWASCAGPGAGGGSPWEPSSGVGPAGCEGARGLPWLLAHRGSPPTLGVPASSPTPLNALLPARGASPPSGLWSRVYPSH